MKKLRVFMAVLLISTSLLSCAIKQENKGMVSDEKENISSDIKREENNEKAETFAVLELEYGSQAKGEYEIEKKGEKTPIAISEIDTMKIGKRDYLVKTREDIELLIAVDIVDTQKPLIIGKDEIEIKIEDLKTFDLRDKIRAVDPVDGQVELDFEMPKITKAGEYSLEVGAKDSNANQTSKTIKLIVLAEEEYSYDGQTSIEVEGRKFLLEVKPDGPAQETVIKDFLYSITADFEERSKIYADKEDFVWFLDIEKDEFAFGVYIESYRIHELMTLSEIEYSIDRGEIYGEDPIYYEGWDQIVEEYQLQEYEIITVHFTQEYSQKASEFPPQWGDGTYYKSYLVGKTSTDSNYRIYDMGKLHESAGI